MTSYYELHAIISTDSGFNIVFFDVICQPAQMRYSTFPCAEHSNEPPKAEIMFARGLHDFLSFISIAQKETFHISFVQAVSGIVKIQY